MSRFILLFLLCFFCYFQTISAQNINLEKIKVIFSLDGLPKIEDVGFDKPENYWQVKYKVKISNEDIEKRQTNEKTIRLKVFSSKFTKYFLTNDEKNRQFEIEIPLSDEIKQFIAKEKSCIIQIQLKAKIKSSFNKKIKQNSIFEWTTKENTVFTIQDNTISIGMEIEKNGNGKKDFGFSIFKK
jgi:hypothetical protein